MRLDKYLSHSTGESRKEIRRLLKRGEVLVNGIEVKDAAMHVSESDEIELFDQQVAAPSEKYIMLHKPEGYLSANQDGDHPSVLNLLDEPRAQELMICGRLDADTTGLLLITSDGQWCHRVASPKHKTGKRYLVETADPIDPAAVGQFEEGILLKGETFRTKPAELHILEEQLAEVVLTEGRYHQVKRMFAATGNKVVQLHRLSVGDIVLDEDLMPGEYRYLTEEEIGSI